MDKFIIDGKEIIPHEKDILNESLILLEKRSKNTLIEYLNTIIKTQNIENITSLNEYGDYACNSSLMLESIILTMLNKLESSHYPKLIDLFKYENEICLQMEKIEGKTYTSIHKRLNDDQKDAILFQLLYTLYETSIYEFVHGDLIGSNIMIEPVEEKEIEYKIEGKSFNISNFGFNVKLIDFEFSRMTAYKTYIFNENIRERYYSQEYDVPYNPSIDIGKLLGNPNLISPRMRIKINSIERFNNLFTYDSRFNVIAPFNFIKPNEVLFLLFDLPLPDKFHNERSIKNINEYKSNSDFSIGSYMAKFPNVDDYPRYTKDEIFDYLCNHKYNRLLYKFLTYFPDIKLDPHKINIGLKSYSKNRKIINKLLNLYNKTNSYIKPVRKFKSIEPVLEDINENEVFDPIMLEYYTIEKFLSVKDNIIFEINGKFIGSNRSYFFNVPDDNLISEVVFSNTTINYSKTLKSVKYLDLSKYGITNQTIDYEYLLRVILSNNVLRLINSGKIIGINYQQISHNTKAYESKYNTMIFNNSHSLTNYSHQWDSAINGYLRSTLTDKDYIKSKDFLKHYERFGEYPDEALENIKDAIKDIDEAFLDSYVTSEEFVVFRGVQDTNLYDGVNSGFISTTKSHQVAIGFANGYSVYEIHVSPGVPYLYMENISLHDFEEEILFPRGLNLSLIEKKGKNYIVQLSLNSENQFNLKKEYKEYDVCIIEDFINEIIDNEEKICYKNTIENDKVIDDITGDEIDFFSSVNFNGRCYNKSTLVSLFNNEEYENVSFLDPFTRIKFSDDVILAIMDDLLLLIHKDDLLINFSKFGYLQIVKFLIENGADIHAQEDQCFINACTAGNLDIAEFLIENEADIHAQDDEAFIQTCLTGYLQIVQFLIENEADIHAQEDQGFINACSSGILEVVEFLIENEADVHTQEDQGFINACSSGDLQIVKFLIENEADIHAQEDQGFIKACSNGNLELIKFLVENEADIHSQGDQGFINACHSGILEVVKFLIENEADVHAQNDGGFIHACYSGNLEVIEFLIENGVDIHTQEDQGFINACTSKNLELIKFLLKNGADIHAKEDQGFINTCSNGDLELIKFLIENGADIHAKNDEGFINACYSRNLELIKFLVKNGANIHIKEDQGFINACHTGNLELIKFLIENGADIHAQNDGGFINACYSGNLELIKFLLENGADIHAQNDEALFQNYGSINLEVVKFLVQNGADIRVQNDQLLIKTCYNGDLELIKFLLENGADIHAQNDQGFLNACYGGNLELIKFLIENGAGISRDNKLLIQRFGYVEPKVIEFLNKNGFNIHN